MNTNDSSDLAQSMKSVEAMIAREARRTRITVVALFAVTLVTVLFLVRPDLPVFDSGNLLSVAGILAALAVLVVSSATVGRLLGQATSKGIRKAHHRALPKANRQA